MTTLPKINSIFLGQMHLDDMRNERFYTNQESTPGFYADKANDRLLYVINVCHVNSSKLNLSYLLTECAGASVARRPSMVSDSSTERTGRTELDGNDHRVTGQPHT